LGETILDQQKILGYFIEEAKEHLETLERGILDLPSVINDQEQVNEMFRAAHSIKGGAAMLGYGSIQKIAHRLEDAFKILRENKLSADQKVESLFLKGYDVLQDLVEKLQSPFGLQNEEAEAIVESADPNFVELQAYLNQLLSKVSQGSAASSVPELSPAYEPALSEQIRSLLKQMLQLFKQEPTDDRRQSIQVLCQRLAQLAPDVVDWQSLVTLSSKAIANSHHSFRTLAPVVIKDLKQGSDYIELNQRDRIFASAALKQLASASQPYLLLPLDPDAMAKLLRQAFNAQQIAQLVDSLGASS
jgi:type IV pili sensor histidine kinase/response regulator